MLECRQVIKELPAGEDWKVYLAQGSGIPYVQNKKGDRMWCMEVFQKAAEKERGCAADGSPPELDLSKVVEGKSPTDKTKDMTAQMAGLDLKGKNQSGDQAFASSSVVSF